MFELFKAFILGAVQGVTEFLPVSSTGHLILFEKLLGISQDTYGLTFDAALHLGTLAAILWFFRKEWFTLAGAFLNTISRLIENPKEFLRKLNNKDTIISLQDDKLVVLLAIATIPGALLGLLLEKKVETVFRSPILVAVMLILFSFVLIYVEKIGRKYKEIKTMSLVDSLFVGFSQGIALIPGVSRSGITIATGMWRGIKREEATKFAFLLSAPIIAGAGGVKFIKVISMIIHQSLSLFDGLFFAVGMISSAIFGYITVKYFIKFVAKHSLYPFVVYRLVLGIIILGVSVIH